MHRRSNALFFIQLAAVAALAGTAGLAYGGSAMPAADDPASKMAVIASGEFTYSTPSERMVSGRLGAPERRTVTFSRPLHIMKRQVSQAEYAECVRQEGCRALDKSARSGVAPNLPVVGVSWQDATRYAAWYSEKTGRRYRLPTYEEWAYAAGEALKETPGEDWSGTEDPSKQWLADYARETERQVAASPHPQPFGSFGTNAAGLQDLNGNVWDWTDTCQERQFLDADGEPMMPPLENCGVRVVAGSHHSLITDFMRDPKSGACSVGVPPANLGIRLVLEP